jgi:hypothetical protein
VLIFLEEIFSLNMLFKAAQVVAAASTACRTGESRVFGRQKDRIRRDWIRQRSVSTAPFRSQLHTAGTNSVAGTASVAMLAAVVAMGQEMGTEVSPACEACMLALI